MGHANKVSMVKQVQSSLDSKLAIGSSKYQAKSLGIFQNHIYSWETYRSYLKHGCYFAKWAKKTHGCKTLEQARHYVDEYLQSRSKLSAYTQKLDASAIAKVYGCSTKDFIKTDNRHRANITRSRGEKIRDRHFSETKNMDFVEFCKSTGLRRSEIKSLKGSQLLEKAGKYYIKVDAGSKGGRYRESPIVGNVEAVVERMKSAGSSKVFDKVPNGADIHSYRADYCTSIYKAYARDVKTLDQSEIYFCRSDLKGTWYDKKAMFEASKALGHNRISVIAEHYIRG